MRGQASTAMDPAGPTNGSHHTCLPRRDPVGARHAASNQKATKSQDMAHTKASERNSSINPWASPENAPHPSRRHDRANAEYG